MDQILLSHSLRPAGPEEDETTFREDWHPLEPLQVPLEHRPSVSL